MATKGKDLTELVDSCDLRKVIGYYYPELDVKPNTIGVIRAIWRDDKQPSFSIYEGPNGQILGKDHATGITYNSYQFIRRIKGLNHHDTLQAIQSLSSASNGSPKSNEANERYERASQNSEFPKALSNRGFEVMDLIRLGIVTEDNNAIIPITNLSGEVVNYKVKLYRGKQKYYYLIKDGPSLPWISEPITDENGNYDVLIIEGELNAMILHCVFSDRGVALRLVGMPGSNSKKIPHELVKDRHVYLYADADEAGNKAIQTWTELCRQMEAKTISVLNNQDSDACDIAGTKGREALANLYLELLSEARRVHSDEATISGYSHNQLIESADKYLKGIVEFPTGFESIDNYTLGLPNSELTIVGALPSVGKSLFVHEVALYNALHPVSPKRVAIFSPDQAVGSVGRLFASKISNISGRYLAENNKMALQEQLAVYGNWSRLKDRWRETYHYVINELFSDEKGRGMIYVNDKLANLGEIEPLAMSLRDKGFEIFIFDYLQFFSLESGDDSGNRYHEVTRVSKLFKALAHNLSAPIITTAQLAQHKFGGNRRNPFPTMYDLKDSGQLIQDGFLILTLYDWLYHEENFRDGVDQYSKGVNEQNFVRCYISKNKEGPADKYFYLKAIRSIPKFEDAIEVNSINRSLS